MKDSEKKSIKFWAEDDQPREKLLLKGKNSLSDAELVAILIGSGNHEESAVELSRRILSSCGDSLVDLSSLSVNDLKKFKGIGEAKAISIIAALELGKRRRSADARERKTIASSKDAYDYMYAEVSDLNYEKFWVILLNRANKVIRSVEISEGGIAGTVADLRKIFRVALEASASAIILCHNHPSGQLQPSEADVKLTEKAKHSGQLIDIPVLDHLIFGGNSYYSFADEGNM